MAKLCVSSLSNSTNEGDQSSSVTAVGAATSLRLQAFLSVTRKSKQIKSNHITCYGAPHP